MRFFHMKFKSNSASSYVRVNQKDFDSDFGGVTMDF